VCPSFRARAVRSRQTRRAAGRQPFQLNDLSHGVNLAAAAEKLAAVDELVSSLGYFGPPAYALAIFVSGTIPFLMFNLLLLGAGSLFGLPLGCAVVYPASLLGACAGFRVGRHFPDSLRRRIPIGLIRHSMYLYLYCVVLYIIRQSL